MITPEPAVGILTRDARRFLVHALAWNIALFGVLRLAWVEQHVIGSLIEFQKSLVAWYGVVLHKGILVNASCSGADVMALCAGVTLAYPLAWRRRIGGVFLGLALILSLNALRIASLYLAAPDPARLKVLHLYVWPVILAVATVAYLLAWIAWSERRSAGVGARWTRFSAWSAAALTVYAASVPWVFTSPTMTEMGAWTASAGAAVLTWLGADVQVTGTVLVTSRGAFRVTPECLFTPTIALYAGVVGALPASRRRRFGYLLLAIPLFFALGVMRLLVLALPPVVADSPVFLAHGFYQIVAGAAAIIVAAHVSLGGGAGVRASRRTLAALAAAAAAGAAIGPLWERALMSAAGSVRVLVPAMPTSLDLASDQQGALALLPAFQLALVTGLWAATSGGRNGRRLLTALGVVAMSQLLFLAAMGAVASRYGIDPHALVVRAWALGVPVLIAVAWSGAGATRGGDHAYRRFWSDVGATFPDLGGAASTAFYRENEERLIGEALGTLDGRTLLKTDLWDEAKNTRILQWAADRGARVFGIDLAEPIVRQARDGFAPPRRLHPAVSDVRRLPFGDATFDAIYSMGTVEHFAETEASVVDLARTLKPGGRLILGVPNRYDPFLRPALVTILHRFGWYAYGYEKSYSRRALRRLLTGAGLDIRMESGILFMPGWLRMLDLWCHTRAPRLAVLTGALVRPFIWLDRHVPGVRRHGYLIAAVGEKAAERITIGVQYLVDARGCEPEALRSLPRLQVLFARVLDELALTGAAAPVWHVFPGQGGITGMVLLTESHLTIHTFPESGRAAIDLYCCRRSAAWPWAERLADALGAREVEVRTIERG